FWPIALLCALLFTTFAQAQCTSSNFDPNNCLGSQSSGDFSSSDPLSPTYNLADAGNTFYIRSNTQNPWGDTSNQQAMDMAFGAGNWTEAFFETLDPVTTFSGGTR